MGCDIHTNLERRIVINGEKKWINIDYWKYNPYYDVDEWEQKMEKVDFYDGRNYNLFALLADVRNRAEITPISEARGIPNNCSQQVKDEYERWGCDAHTPSYYTLKELMEYYNRNKSQIYKGMISKEQQNALDVNGELPDSWCGYTSIEGYEMREWQDDSALKYFIEPFIKRAKEEFLFRYDEDNTGVYENSEDIRVVFWFDN